MASVDTVIRDVWSYNLLEQMEEVDNLLFDYPVVAIDTEFPGIFVETPRYCEDESKYFNLKYNVDCAKIIQLGLSLSDENGNIGGVWEFNFRFNLDSDLYSHNSIEFLKKSGINFEKLKTDGVDGFIFSRVFACVLRKHQDLKWLSFHGLYDFAHLTKLLINNPLPATLLGFSQLLGKIFGHVVDLKYIAKYCEGLLDDKLGLEKMARLLGVKRIGQAHNAGSDSLLTGLIFAKINEDYDAEESDYVGYLYGIHSRIRKFQPEKVMSPVRYYRPQPNIVLVHPLPLPLPPPVGCGLFAMQPMRRNGLLL